MTDDARDGAAGGDLDAVVAGMQAQIEALMQTLESHQRLFERLRATGVLVGDDDSPVR